MISPCRKTSIRLALTTVESRCLRQFRDWPKWISWSGESLHLRYDKCCSIFDKVIKRGLNGSFGPSVDHAGRFVKDNNPGILDYRSSESNL